MNIVKELGPGARFDLYHPTKGTIVVLGRKVGNTHPIKITDPSNEEATEYKSMKENELLETLQNRKGGFSNRPALETNKDKNIFTLLNDTQLQNPNNTNNKFIVTFDQNNLINGVFPDTTEMEKDKLDKYVILSASPTYISFIEGKNKPQEFLGELEIVNWLLGYN